MFRRKIDVSNRTYCGKRISQLELDLNTLCLIHDCKVLMQAESESIEIAIQALTDLINAMKTSKKWDYV